VSVVFFTYAYPPLKYPRSVQISRLVKYSAHKIRVVCCADGSATDDTIAGDGSRGPETLDVFQKRPLVRFDPRRLIARLSVPDPLLFWARKTAKTVLSRGLVGKADVLVTFGQPMSSHLAGLSIQRATGAPWIAHFSDPWVDNPFRRRVPLTGLVNRHMERKVIAQADRVVFTSGETVDLVMKKYPESWRQKAVVIPHAFDPELYGSDPGPNKERIIRYLGDFYGNRTPEILVKALVEIHRTRPDVLRNIRFELIGNMPADMARAVDDSSLPAGLLVIRSSTDYQTSLRLMREAALLLVIDAAFEKSVFLPSKLIDYIGSGRPVFAITPPGTARALVEKLSGFIADPSNVEQVAQQLIKAIGSLRNGHEKIQASDEVRERYAAPRVAASFDALIDELAGKQGVRA